MYAIDYNTNIRVKYYTLFSIITKLILPNQLNLLKKLEVASLFFLMSQKMLLIH